MNCIDSAELLFYEISYCHAFSSDAFASDACSVFPLEGTE